MKLPKIAIKNYQFTVILVVILVLAGLVSFINMPRAEDPTVAKPGTSIIVIYPGASPKDMEHLVTDRIEAAVNELDDVKRINSSCEDSLAVINVEFEFGTDPDEKFSDVNEKVNGIKNDLPGDIFSLSTKKWTIADTNFLQIALISEQAEYAEMEKQADLLKKKLEKVRGVRKVQTWGFPEQEVQILLDMEKIAQLKIPLNRIVGLIKANNQNIPGGSVYAGSKKFNVQTSGFYQDVEEIRNIVIHTDGKKNLYLKDVARVKVGYEENKHVTRHRGERAVFVSANQKIGTNIFEVMGRIRQSVASFKQTLPESLRLAFVFDQSESVSYRLNIFFSNLIQGMVLVGLVVLVTIGLRGSMLVMLAIPVSIFIAFGFLDLSGYGIQQMTIAGLVITLGLLVDNAIVVIENISRFVSRGETLASAAVNGTRQIGWAIVSATATTILAFVPIIMMQDVAGEYIRSMPLTVIYTLSASLLIALTLTPFLASKFLKPQKRLPRIQKGFDRFINRVYSRILKGALARPKRVVALAVVVFLGSLSLFPIIGTSLFPKAEKNLFFIDVSTPEGTHIEKTDQVARYVEGVLAGRPEIRLFTTNVGHTNPQIYYNIIDRQGKSNLAHFYVKLKNRDKGMIQRLIDQLRQEFAHYPGARIEVKELEQGPPVEAPVAVKVMGKNVNMLKQMAAKVESALEKINGLININNPLSEQKTDLCLKINRHKAGMLGVSLLDIDRTVRMSIEGLHVSDYRDPEGHEYKIKVQAADRNGHVGLGIFDKIYVHSLTGTAIPLGQLASLDLKQSPTVINHYNLERSVTVTADVLTGLTVSKLTARVEAQLRDMAWPKGYSWYLAGEKEAQEETFGGMAKAVLVAIIAIFGVLVMQFKSFLQPLIVFAALPLAIIGSILFLLITGYSFSFTAFVGLTSLVGIVVNNSIILVDYTNQLRRQGKNSLEAIQTAGETRFKPIVLTTLTTIGGLLPLTLGGGTLWGPMGWTIIGGLATSTVLTLVVVPVLYLLFTPKTA
jgi:multidrug efflux pump subunit AcrB